VIVVGRRTETAQQSLEATDTSATLSDLRRHYDSPWFLERSIFTAEDAEDAEISQRKRIVVQGECRIIQRSLGVLCGD
jgi:hypothetical protein